MKAPITVLGGGPAGCAAALTLRRYLPDIPVIMLVRPVAAETFKAGETLAPGVLPLLEYLGLREAFVQQNHLPCGGTASAWGASHPVARSYLFTGRGHGWHLDRARFDAWLLAHAVEAGVRLVQDRPSTVAFADGTWQIEVESGDTVHTDAIVEATGRTSWFLRQQAIAPTRHDALVAEARWFQHDDDEAAAEGALVEAVADGWWYSATLPSKRGVAMFMTDSDLRSHASWEERLGVAPATSRRLVSWRATGEAANRVANSQCAAAVVGKGWVAAGDAAAAFDPISALGIGFSLRSGMEAARVAVGYLEGDTAPADEYATSMRRIVADYRARLEGIYRMEQRWPEGPFWSRRHLCKSATGVFAVR